MLYFYQRMGFLSKNNSASFAAYISDLNVARQRMVYFLALTSSLISIGSITVQILNNQLDAMAPLELIVFLIPIIGWYILKLTNNTTMSVLFELIFGSFMYIITSTNNSVRGNENFLFFLFTLCFIYFENIKILIAFFIYLSTLILLSSYNTFSSLSVFVPDPFLEIYSTCCALFLISGSLFFLKTLLLKNQALKNEQSIVLNESIEVKNKIFAIISHDLKAPIRNVNMLLNSQLKEDETYEVFKSVNPKLEKELSNTKQILENITNWMHFELDERKDEAIIVDLNDFFNTIISQQEISIKAKNIQITVINNLNKPTSINVLLLQIVIRNILSNAIKFSYKGGEIIISSFINKHNKLEFTIKDFGKGLTQKEIEKIKDANFYSTNGSYFEEGNGVGLLICMWLLQKTKAELIIYPNEAEGTKVGIIFNDRNYKR